MASAEDRAHAERLLFEHRRRLRALELRKVRAGDSADPAIDTQIEDTRRDVSVLEALLETSVSDDVRDTIRRNTEGDFDFTMLFLQGVKQNERITKIEEKVEQVERQNSVEAQERPQRQRQLDDSISKINTRLDGQDKILEGQDKKLDTLFDDGRWRFWLMVGILIVCSFVALRVALVWLGLVS